MPNISTNISQFEHENLGKSTCIKIKKKEGEDIKNVVFYSDYSLQNDLSLINIEERKKKNENLTIPLIKIIIHILLITIPITLLTPNYGNNSVNFIRNISLALTFSFSLFRFFENYIMEMKFESAKMSNNDFIEFYKRKIQKIKPNIIITYQIIYLFFFNYNINSF